MFSSNAPVAPPDVSMGDLTTVCASKLQAVSAQRSGGGGAPDERMNSQFR
jgi:hypothetical protein